jgi:hypothetical protein
MSNYAQSYPDGLLQVRTELFGCTKQHAIWVDDLLAAIATYPLDYSTYLSEGDTIDVGQPIDRRGSKLTGVLLAPPGVDDPETVGLVGGISGNVLVHQVVGILPEEAEFAKEHGGKRLWERLAKNGPLLLDDDLRVPVT